MNKLTFAIFAAVYLVIALSTRSMPLVSSFFMVCTGLSVLKAVAASADTKPVRRSPFGYARR